MIWLITKRNERFSSRLLLCLYISARIMTELTIISIFFIQTQDAPIRDFSTIHTQS